MYGIFANIYPKNHQNVGKYSIHGASGIAIIQKIGHMPWLPQRPQAITLHREGYRYRLDRNTLEALRNKARFPTR